VKLFFKFLISLLSLPFLIPWFLADKTFELFFQPLIFKRYKLGISRTKRWLLKSIKWGLPIALIGYLMTKTIVFFSALPEFLGGLEKFALSICVHL